MIDVPVKLGPRSYLILVGAGLLSQAGPEISRLGEEGELAPHPEPGDLRTGLREQTSAHEDAVRAGAELDGDVDHRTSRLLPGLEVVEIALVVAADLVDAIPSELL